MKRALATLAVVAGCTAEPATGERGAAITGGTVDLGDDAVLALGYRARPCGEAPAALCTGTLIAPRAILTAAHCVMGESPASIVAIAGPRVDGGQRLELDAIHIHPDFDGVSADLAILALAEPLPQAPIAVRRAPLDASAIGGSVRLIGFGADAGGAGGVTGVKRQGSARITEVQAAKIVIAPDPALTCNGDSGGPVLVADELAGVVAYGDPACAASSTSTRADIHVDTFITPTLAAIAASAPASRAGALCTACDRAEDCPRDSDCVGGICAVVGVEVSGLGGTCTDEASCGGAPCLAGLDDTACRCMVVCSDTDGCGCRSAGTPGGALLVLLVLVGTRRRAPLIP